MVKFFVVAGDACKFCAKPLMRVAYEGEISISSAGWLSS